MTDIVLFRCNNTMCRIETFKGVNILPLNTCPVCQMVSAPQITAPQLRMPVEKPKEKFPALKSDRIEEHVYQRTNIQGDDDPWCIYWSSRLSRACGLPPGHAVHAQPV